MTACSSSEDSRTSPPDTSSSVTSPTGPQSPERHDSLSSEPGSDNVKPIEEGVTIENVQEAECVTPQAVALTNFSPIDGVDPFGQMPVKLSEGYHAMLQHSLRIYQYAGNNYKLAFLPQHLRSGINQFPITRVVQQSVQKPHHLYSLMATIAIRTKHIYGSNLGDESPESFRDKSAHHIRKELMRNSKTGKVDKQTILDICFLSVSEMSYQQYESARTHMKVVAKLMPLLDTREHFDFWISETAAHVDNQLALLSGGRPVIPFSFDPGPMLPERMVTLKRELGRMYEQGVSLQLPSPLALRVAKTPLGMRDAIAELASDFDLRMGSRFEYGLKMGIFDRRMGRIISDLTDCIAIAKVVWLSPLAVCFDAEWLCRKSRACLRSLLTIAPENNIGPLDVLGKCMEGARISILIMLSHACTLMGPQTARLNVRRLRQAMDFALTLWCQAFGLTSELVIIEAGRLTSFATDQLGFILWSAIVGVASATEDPETERFFIVRCCNMCKILGIRSFDDLQNHMVQLMYSKTLLEPSVRRVAQYLEGN